MNLVANFLSEMAANTAVRIKNFIVVFTRVTVWLEVMNCCFVLRGVCRWRLESKNALNDIKTLVPIREKKILPDIMMKTVFSYWKSPVAPNPVIRVQIINGKGKSVGIASYGISPISDRVYVFGIDIDIEFQRQGYASAFLKCLAREYQLPITPIKELNSAKSFWASVRHMTHCGLIVTQGCDMNDERKRWKYLQPEIDRLEKQILERLERGESWFDAVGRGLD